MSDVILRAIPLVLGLLAYSSSHRITRLRRFALAPCTADRIVFILAISHVFVFGALTLLLHFTLNGADDDVGLFHQVVWNSLRGRLLETSLLPDVTLLIGQRFSPILLAFVPLYAVWSSPAVLLLVQTLGIAASVFPLYWFARVQIGRTLGVLVAFTYLMYPALQHVNLFGFHEIALAIPILSFACFFLLRAHYIPFLICLLVSLLIKEEMAIVAAGFGVYLFFVVRQRWLGLLLAVGGVTWFLVLLQWLIPLFRDAPPGFGYYYFGFGAAAGYGRYDYLGKSLTEIITTVLTKPDLVLAHLLVARKMEYVIDLLMPLGLLSLVGFEVFILALPALAISLLSDYRLQTSIASHYAASIIAFVWFAVVIGIRRFTRAFPSSTTQTERFARIVGVGVLLSTAGVVNYHLIAPGPLARNFDSARFTMTSRTLAGYELLGMIPSDAVVVAQRGLVLHTSGRQRAYEFPSSPNMCQVEYIVADQTQHSFAMFQNDWQTYMSSRYFEIVAEKEGFILAKRRSANQVTEVTFDSRLTFAKHLLVDNVARGGTTICPIIEWRAERVIPGQFIIHARLVDSRGHIFARDDREPRGGLSPTHRWLAGQTIADQFTLEIPSTAPSGTYRVTVGVYDPLTDRYLEAHDANGLLLDYEATVATLQIRKDHSSKTASELRIENPLLIDMNEIRLFGLATLPHVIEPGQRLSIGYYWRARGKPRGDYQVVSQLRNANNAVVLEQAGTPADGTYPTSAWQIGEALLDWHDLDLPRDLKQGEYKVFVLVRDLTDRAILGQAQVAQIKVEK